MKKLILLFVGIIFVGSIWGQTPVGTGQTYTTLKSAFDAINAGTLTGDVVLQITSITTETASAVLNASGGSSSYTSVTIYPTGSGYSISGSVAGALIQLNGADNVTIDGRVSQTGAKDLIIQNTNTSNATIELKSDATGNFIQYCVIKGATTSSSNGIVLFSAGTSTGNDNNTIDHNDINASGTAVNCIYSAGSVGVIHNAVTISNNNIYDFRGAGSTGINLASYNSDWTIDGNSIYQTGAGYAGVSGTTYGIQVGSIGVGNAYLIQNNYIGGSSANGVGTWTINGTAAAFRFQGINLNVGTATASSIQNNTIKGFSWLSTSGASSVPGVWCGIYLSAGNANIGTVTGNTIGDAGTGSITVQINSTGGVTAGIIAAGNTANFAKNTISSFTLTGSSVSVSHGFNGIWVSAGTTTTIDNNTIGSTSVTNSINCSNASTHGSAQSINGILNASTGSISITNNTIANLNNNYSNTTTVSANRGISITAGSSTVAVNNNTIFNITGSQNLSGTGSTTNIVGIHIGTTNPTGVSVNSNVIYGLKSMAASAATNVAGIYYNGTTSGINVVSKNLIHSLSNNSSSTSASLYGISIGGGTTTYHNNMIRLGLEAAGTNIATGFSFVGINDASGTNNFYFNSVYIGGSPASGSNTFAFNSAVTFNTRVFQNNIFVNNRTNTAGSAKHYAFKVGGSGVNPSGLTSNYNILYANGTGGILGLYNSADLSSIKAWREATGQDLNSGYGDPNYTNATTDISASPTTFALKVSGTTPAEASGILIAGITDDIEGNTRSSLTPTDIGADAGDYTASDIFTPNFTYTSLSNTSSTSNRTLSVTMSDIGTGVSLSGTLAPRIWFRNFTTLSAWASAVGVNNTGTGNNGTWTFTIDYSLIGGTPAGNAVIQYYLVAQDQAGTPNIWYSPFVGAAHTDVNTQTTAPTTPNSFTILNTFTGTINVGTAQTYTTLTATGGLFEAINAGAVTGNIVVNIVSDITETGANALNQWTEEGAGGYTMTIQSDGTLRTLSNSANLAVPLIKINGADRVTIDGLSGKKLLFRNTNTAAGSTTATVLFDNGSTSCTLTNCVIENNSTSTSNGSVQVNTTGTNDITISSNEIRNPTGGTVNDYYQGIYSNSSTNKLSISSNSIYNWTNYGIRLNAAADACTVSGNSLYRTNSWAITSVTVIAVKGGNGHTISGNYIGGNDVNCGGAALNNTGNVFFMGLDVTNVGTTSTTSITNNTFQNINLSGAASVTFLGISGGSAKLNVGNTVGTGNLIGHTSTAQSIRISGTNATAFTGISLNGTGAATVYGVNYNEIANIYVTANTAVKAIDVAAASSAVASITYNNIHDITAFNTGATAAIRGINNSGSNGGTLTISNNTISNLTSPTSNTGTTTSFAVIGILCTSTVNTQNITNNTISGLSLTTAGNNAVKSAGIMCGGASSSGSISKNNISGFTSTSTSTTNQMVGIYNYNGAFTIDNNIISITNGANTNVAVIQGILDNNGVGSCNYYYNSVYIGGSAASGAVNSFAFSRSAVTTIVVKDNIFSNQRTGGTGKHIAIALQANSTITSDYNDLYASTATNIGSINGGTAALDFATWKSTVTGQDVNSISADPLFTSTTNLLPQSGSPAIGTGTAITVTTDIDGATRSLTTPTIGAYEVVAETLTWTGAVDNDWNKSTNWSPDGVPFATTSVNIPNVSNDPVVNQPVSSPAQCNNLTIESGTVLTINPAKALTVSGTLTNNGGTAGLVIKSNVSGTGSLKHNTADVPATIECYIDGSSTLTAMKYHQVSIPLTSAASPTSNLFTGSYLFDFTESTGVSGEWTPLGGSTSTPLDVNKGYLIYYPDASTTYTFAGPMNNGTITQTLSFTDAAHGFNLVPNPYPSAIDWTLIPTKTNLNDAFWIWNPTSSNFGAYGSEVGTGTSATTKDIATGQAFFVRASAAASVLSINNSARLHSSQTFLKNGTKVENQLRIAAAGNNSADEVLIAFNENWSFGNDNADVDKVYGADVAPQLSSVSADGKNLSINALPFSSGNVIVPLNFALNASGDVTFTASGLDSFYESISIYLEDKELNTLTDLRTQPVYTFSHNTGSVENRFQLRFKGVTGTNELPETTQGSVFVSQGSLFVDVPAMQQSAATIGIFDALGRQISTCKVVINGIVKLEAPMATGMYIVRVLSGSQTFTGKVIFK